MPQNKHRIQVSEARLEVLHYSGNNKNQHYFFKNLLALL